MALNRVKVIGQLKDVDVVLVPVQENGTEVYKMYQVYTKHFDTDELVYDEIQYKAPMTKESFSMDSDISVDSFGMVILDTEKDTSTMKKYRSTAKGAVESRTVGNFMYDTASNQVVINHKNIRVGRCTHNGATLPVYHTTKFLETKGDDGEYVHNFYLATGHQKVLEPMFGHGIKATKTRPTLLAESKVMTDPETHEDMTYYVNTHNMQVYAGIYSYLTDKNRKNDRYDMFRDTTSIAGQETNERIADLEFRLRGYRNTTSISAHVLNRLEAAIERLKKNPTVANYYHCKLVQEIITTQLARQSSSDSLSKYLDKKVQVLARKEGELTFGGDGM